ncbi:MFS transporter [Anaeromyxobacter diazotrophicus]|uniref:MFS transporter n=1 Tax=Anaeromyxobacter diazotrophicus TaxID=2590199 RepID=UPI001592221F|nr:MFS transporter [Anaeromyxobacter diazotrophicus]
MTACAGGAALTAWALQVGASPALVALLAALPALAQVLHFPAARLTARHGPRRVALAASIAARQPYLALVALPFLPLTRTGAQLVVAAVAVSSCALASIAQQAWMIWTPALYRAPVRSRVLGRRAGRAAVSGAAASLAVGVFLDGHAGAARVHALSLLAILAWAAGLLAAFWLARQAPPPRRERAMPSASRALADGGVRRVLGYVCAWNAALGITAAITALHMLQGLHLGFVAVSVHGAGVAAGCLLGAPLWGKMLDRFGAGRVLVASTAGAASLPFLWLGIHAGSVFTLALDAALGGTLLAGQALASVALPLQIAPRHRRAEVVAAFSTAGGLSFAAASLATGVLSDKLPLFVFIAGRVLLGRKLLFAAGGAVRLAAAALGLRAFGRAPSPSPA